VVERVPPARTTTLGEKGVVTVPGTDVEHGPALMSGAGSASWYRLRLPGDDAVAQIDAVVPAQALDGLDLVPIHSGSDSSECGRSVGPRAARKATRRGLLFTGRNRNITTSTRIFDELGPQHHIGDAISLFRPDE
jgi:hypothetical protein